MNTKLHELKDSTGLLWKIMPHSVTRIRRTSMPDGSPATAVNFINLCFPVFPIAAEDFADACGIHRDCIGSVETPSNSPR